MLKDLLRYRVNPVRFGMALLGIFLVFLAIAYAVNRSFTFTFWDRGYELKADFSDADGIANASDVRIAGAYAGQVTNITARPDGLAEITFRLLPADAPVHSGTKVQLRLQTLLGTKFLEVVPGPSSGSQIQAGSTIPVQQTQSPVDFDQILQSFDQPTRDNLSQLVKELGATTDGRGADINSLLSDLHALSVNSTPDLQTFSDRSTNLDGIVRNLDTVGGTLADNREHLAGLQANLDTTLATIAQNDRGFRAFIEQGNTGLGHGIAQFQGNEQNFNQLLQLAHPALDKLNPLLVQVDADGHKLDPFISVSKLFVGDLYSAVTQYNHNASNAKCGAAGCGGFYLRQPTTLASSNGVNQETTPPFSTSTASPNLPHVPLPPLPPVPQLPGLFPGVVPTPGQPGSPSPSPSPGILPSPSLPPLPGIGSATTGSADAYNAALEAELLGYMLD